MTTLNVSLLITFLKTSCDRESVNEHSAGAPRVHMNPFGYFAFDPPLESSVESPWSTRRLEEMVRRTRALTM
ncbi:hypothetical protein ACFX19_004818 [Malus domestica]